MFRNVVAWLVMVNPFASIPSVDNAVVTPLEEARRELADARVCLVIHEAQRDADPEGWAAVEKEDPTHWPRERAAIEADIAKWTQRVAELTPAPERHDVPDALGSAA